MFKYNIPLNKKDKFQNSKWSTFLTGAAFILLALAIGIVIRPLIAEKPAIASGNVGDEAINQNGYEMDKLPISPEDDEGPMPVYTEDDKQIIPSVQPDSFTQTSNGVEITVSNFRREEELIKVDICFDMPDKSDWMLDRTATLMFGEEQVVLRGFKNLEWKQATEGQMGYRCDTAKFEVPVYADNAELTLNISQISAPPREGEECDFYLDRVQQELNLHATGITIGCTTEEWGSTITILNKPIDMSLEDAEQMVLSDEFYALHGTWEFTFRLD